ncbi:MAG TPA: MFS transporter [Pseudomonadales bacterium]
MMLSLSALLGSVALLVSGNTLLMSVLGVRLGLEGIDPTSIGWIMSCYAVGFVFGSLHSYRIIERVGHIRAFATFAGLASIAALMHPLIVDIAFWSILRLVSGISVAGMLLAIESWLSTRASNDSRATLFAGYQMCFYLSATCGQLLLGLSSPTTFEPFNLAGMLLVAALVPLALTRLPAPAIEPAGRLPLGALYRLSPLGPVTCVASGIVISAFGSMGPVYGTLTGLDLDSIARFMAAGVLAAVVFAWPLGRLSDRMDRRRMLLLMSLAGCAFCAAAATLGTTAPWLLIVFSACFMGISAALYPVAVALINDRLQQAEVVPASATLLLGFGIGSCLGPLLIAALIDLVGPGGFFWGITSVLALLSAYAAQNQHEGLDITVAAQETFATALPETAPVIAELDPRPDVYSTESPPEQP